MKFTVGNTSQLGFWITLIVRMELENDEPVITLICLSSLREIDPKALRAGEIVFSEYLAPGDTKESDNVPDCETTMELQAIGSMPRLLCQSMVSEGEGGVTLSLQIMEPPEPPERPQDGPLLADDTDDRPNEIVVVNELNEIAFVTVLENNGEDWPFPGRPPRFRTLIVTSERLEPSAYENSVLVEEHEILPGNQIVMDGFDEVDGLAYLAENGFCQLTDDISVTDGWRILEITIVPYKPTKRPRK